MIKMQLVENKMCPQILCDKCGEVIENYKDGIVLFDSKNGTTSSIPSFYHRSFHANHCDDSGKQCVEWLPLDVFLFNLMHNVKVDYMKAKETAQRLMEI
jgi:predicted molibdopterin-dependent oxidoreductase YjgC